MLVFTELPHPPNNVKADLRNTCLGDPECPGHTETPGLRKSVNVSWSKAFDGNSPITNYIVQMRVIPTTGMTAVFEI